MSTSPGSMLTNGLRLERLLGRGGMGSVWLARNLALDTEVAVKLIAPELAADAVLRERFVREARAAARIQSPHVVRVLDFGVREEDATPYIVMDVCHGETLRSRLARAGRLAPSQTARIVRELGAALEAAHALGIVHRDIKPENVFLDGPSETIKVLDFGVAKYMRGGDKTLTVAGMLLGTPAYMGPEQLLFPERVEPAYDLWSLAVVAYEMVTGENPFVPPGAEPATLTELCERVCSGRFAPPSARGAHSELDAFFARALALDPAQRFASAQALTTAFDSTCARSVAPSADPASSTLVAARVLPPPGPAAAATLVSAPAPPAATRAADPAAPVHAGPRLAAESRNRRRASVVAALALAVVCAAGALAIARPWQARSSGAAKGPPPRPVTTATGATSVSPAPTASSNATVAPAPSSSAPVAGELPAWVVAFDLGELERRVASMGYAVLDRGGRAPAIHLAFARAAQSGAEGTVTVIRTGEQQSPLVGPPEPGLARRWGSGVLVVLTWFQPAEAEPLLARLLR